MKLTTENTENTERATPETDAEVTTFTSISKLKQRFECSTGKVSAEFARRLERERDEAREALMKIEDLFIDGTDIYADRENMGLIAKAALEETK